MAQSSYIPSNNGLQSYIDAAPSYELAPIGIASMQDQAQKLAEMGRNGDIYVVHAAEGETVIPMEVLEANPQIKALLFNQMTEMGLDPQRYVVGDKLNSLNPVTGMPEFFFKSIFKGIKKAVKSVVKVVKKIAPVALPIIGATIGLPFLGPAFAAGSMASMALTSGIGTLVGGGSLKDAFKSALTAGATAGIFGALKGATPSSWGFGGTGPKGFTLDKAKEGVKQAALGGYYKPPTSLVTTSGEGLAALANAPTDFTPAVQTEGLTWQRFGAPVSSPPGSPAGGEMFSTGLTPGGPSRTTTLVPPPPASTVNLSNVPRPPVGPTPALSRTEQVLAEYNNIIAANPSLEGTEGARLAREAVDAANKGPLLGSFSPSKFIKEQTGYGGEPSNIKDLAIAGLGAYGLGAFDVAEQEDITKEDRPDIGGGRVLTLAERQAAADEQELQQASLDPLRFIPNPNVLQPFSAAHGGSVEYPRRELLVAGPGTEKSDDIPAMLSDGEFVINSKAVRGADPSGGGNRYAGAQNLYNLMRNFEMRA